MINIVTKPCGACHDKVIAAGWCSKCTLPDEEDQKYFKGFTFNPPQSEAYRILKENPRCSFIAATGTGTGKTSIAEMCILAHKKSGSLGRILVLEPLKALAHEKVESWRLKFTNHTVCELTSDNEDVGYGAARNAELMQHNIVVCSYEMLDSMSRKPVIYNYLDTVDLIIIDEIHELGDLSRGGNLDGAITRFLRYKKKKDQFIQVVALSATFDNLDNLSEYFNQFIDNNTLLDLDGTLLEKVNGIHVITSDFCPISVNVDEEISQYNNFSKHDRANLISQLAIQKYEETRGQVLIIALSIPLINSVAYNVNRTYGKQIATTHYSELSADERHQVEKLYNKGDIKILCATPTLLAGVNLACQSIILDMEFFNQDTLTNDLISISKIKQAAGRAGRLPYYKDAYVVYVCGSDLVHKAYLRLQEKNIIRGTLLRSLETVINAEVSMSEKILISDLKEWYKMTFSYMSREKLIDDNISGVVIGDEVYTDEWDYISHKIDVAITRLNDAGFIKKLDDTLYSMNKGVGVSMLFLNPIFAESAMRVLMETELIASEVDMGSRIMPLLEEIFGCEGSEIMLNNRKLNYIEPYFRLHWLIRGNEVDWYSKSDAALTYPWIKNMANVLTRLDTFYKNNMKDDEIPVKGNGFALIHLISAMFEKGPIPVGMARLSIALKNLGIAGYGNKRLALLYLNGITSDNIVKKKMPEDIQLPTWLVGQFMESGFEVKKYHDKYESILPKTMYSNLVKKVNTGQNPELEGMDW